MNFRTSTEVHVCPFSHDWTTVTEFFNMKTFFSCWSGSLKWKQTSRPPVKKLHQLVSMSTALSFQSLHYYTVPEEPMTCELREKRSNKSRVVLGTGKHQQKSKRENTELLCLERAGNLLSYKHKRPHTPPQTQMCEWLASKSFIHTAKDRLEK